MVLRKVMQRLGRCTFLIVNRNNYFLQFSNWVFGNNYTCPPRHIRYSISTWPSPDKRELEAGTLTGMQARHPPLFSAQPPIDTACCPLCGAVNGCLEEKASCTRAIGEVCWCMSTDISDSTLRRIAPEARGRACICQRCAADVGEKSISQPK